jgi:hypothetical protein
LSLAATACGDVPIDSASDETETRALVSIKRTTTLTQESREVAPPTEEDLYADGLDAAELPLTEVITREVTRAQASAHFVELPEFNQPGRVLELAGLVARLPENAACLLEDLSSPSEVPASIDDLASVGRLDLLDAGEVRIFTDRASTELAPRAFPSVSDFVSGVMYTSRDQSDFPLPAGGPYTVRVTGTERVPFVEFDAEAPSAPSDIWVNETPLASLDALVWGRPVAIRWAGEAANMADSVIYVELSSELEPSRVRCLFDDQALNATIPGELTSAMLGSGQFSIHRYLRRAIRGAAMGVPELQSAQDEFDFSVGKSLNFVSSDSE